MKISSLKTPNSPAFGAKYAIKRSAAQGQLGEFMDIISEKAAYSRQLSTKESKDGSEIIIDIHNRFKKNFERVLDDRGIYWEEIIDKIKK